MIPPIRYLQGSKPRAENPTRTIRDVARNRRARFDYEILDKIEVSLCFYARKRAE